MKQNKRQAAKKASPSPRSVDKSGDGLDDLRAALRPFRGRIDALDDKIMALLAKRFAIVRTVGALKAAHNFPSYISDRVVEVRERNAATGAKYGIDPDFVRTLYNVIIYQSCAEEDIIKHARRHKTSALPAKKRKTGSRTR